LPTTDIIASAVARWEDPTRRPLFKGKLVDRDGCMCAQGDILHHELGWSVEKLRRTAQVEADREVARALDISVAHAILLRNVNDSEPGAPSIVLTNPEKVIGDQAPTILAFWRHLDRMTDEQWAAARDAARDAAWDAARDAARDAAWDAARDAARDAAWAAAWDAAWDAASYAVAEIMGARVLRERGTPFFFLPMFGFSDPEAVLAADEAA